MMPRVWIVALTLSIPFSLINFHAYLKGSSPSLFQAAVSTLFVLFWFVSSATASHKGWSRFLLAATVYWLVGLVLLLFGYMASVAILFIPSAILFAGPLYGLQYYVGVQADMALVAYLIGINYMAIIIGYGLGLIFKRSSVELS